MKTEIRCSNCNSTWHVAEKTASGEMLCPVCLTRIVLDGPKPTTARRAATKRRSSALAVEADRPALPEEVVCPRCRLHFSPFSKRSRPDQDPAGRRKTVLVIEDQKYFREVAADALKAAYEVKTAATAREAEAVLAQSKVDLIVLDLTLGGEDSGRRLLQRLKPKPCPIVIFTAEDESEMYGDSWEELSTLGADDLVIKGIHVGESLLKKVAALLGTSEEELEAAKLIG